ERTAPRLDAPLDPRLEARAEVRADVEDDPVGVDRAADLDRVLERRDRLLVEVVLRAREVDEVERVADDGADPGLGAALLEPLEALRLVIRRPPGAGALREDLDGVAAEVLGTVDRRVDTAGRGQVRAEVHGCRIKYRRPALPARALVHKAGRNAGTSMPA